MTACFSLMWLSCQMMTLLSLVFLSVMALIPDNDCMLSPDVAVMPDDDLTESSVSVCHGSYIMTLCFCLAWLSCQMMTQLSQVFLSVVAPIPDIDHAFSTDMALMPDGDLVESDSMV